MIDFNDNIRRRYSPLDRDKLFLLDDIAEHLHELPAIGDELHRIADALEGMTGSHAQTADAPSDNTDTRLKTLDEKSDAVFDVLGVIAGAVAPNAPFSLRRFSNGSGRFLPTDTPTPTDTPATDD